MNAYERRRQCRFCPATTTSVYGACWRHPLRHCIYCGTSTVHPGQVCAEHEDLPALDVEAMLERLTRQELEYVAQQHGIPDIQTTEADLADELAARLREVMRVEARAE